MPKIRVNNIEMYYELHGGGSPILLFNGWGGSTESWNPEMIKELAGFHRVITLDNRGTGRSDKPDIEYSIEMMTDDAAGLLDAIKVPKTHVLGFSMGGTVAQMLALNHPEKVLSLILCATTCGGPHSMRNRPQNRENLSTLANPSPAMTKEEAVLPLLRGLYTPNYLHEHLEELIKDETSAKYPTPPFALRRQSQALSKFDSYDRLPKIGVPTLVLVGDADTMVPHENSLILAERIPGAKLRIFKNTSHGFLKQVREEAVAVILDFLAGIDLAA
jgi:pimeloyl-ACP methyl ester carboxylesterase